MRMMTVHEVSEKTGVTVRALRFYDEKGLLKPAKVTEAGYRLYDRASLERLQQILLFRELEFSLSDIKRILDSPGFDRKKALEQQIRLLTLKKEHTERLLSLALEMKNGKGEKEMSFDAFDKKKMEAYAAEAKKTWGGTEAWREYEEKAEGKTEAEQKDAAAGLMEIFAEFGKIMDERPEGPQAQELVKRLQGYITAHFYTCTDEILAGLGQMYAAGGEMTDNIDRAGGTGTAAFAAQAIEARCKK